MIQQFTRLLEALQLESKWATLLADWIDADVEPNGFEGGEDTLYLAQNPAYRAPNAPIVSISELLALPGFGIDPTQPGTLLLDQPQILDLALWTGSPTPFSIAVPNNPLLLGPKLLLQGAMFDPQAAHIGLTRALRVVIGE